MFRILLGLFLLVPLIEIYLLITIGSIIGPLLTVFFVVFTAVLGAFLLRLQGFATLSRVRKQLMQGELPAAGLIEGALLLISGALLLTPGFFTDTIGFLCLIPALRQRLANWALQHFVVQQNSAPNAHGNSYRGREKIIEGDFYKDE